MCNNAILGSSPCNVLRNSPTGSKTPVLSIKWIEGKSRQTECWLLFHSLVCLFSVLPDRFGDGLLIVRPSFGKRRRANEEKVGLPGGGGGMHLISGEIDLTQRSDTYT